MAATSNIPLKVPFKEKDEAKSHGARWNPDGKHWYIPVGVDETPFEKWLAGAPSEISQQEPTTPPSTSHAKKNAKPLPSNLDMDDINAMLRDAFEDSSSSEM